MGTGGQRNLSKLLPRGTTKWEARILAGWAREPGEYRHCLSMTVYQTPPGIASRFFRNAPPFAARARYDIAYANTKEE